MTAALRWARLPQLLFVYLAHMQNVPTPEVFFFNVLAAGCKQRDEHVFVWFFYFLSIFENGYNVGGNNNNKAAF